VLEVEGPTGFVSGPLVRRFGVGGVLVGSSALVALSALAFAVSPGFAPWKRYGYGAWMCRKPGTRGSNIFQ